MWWLHSVDDIALEWSATGLKSLVFSGLSLHLHCLSWHFSTGSKFNLWHSGMCLCGSESDARTTVVLVDSGLPSALLPPSDCLNPIHLLGSSWAHSTEPSSAAWAVVTSPSSEPLILATQWCYWTELNQAANSSRQGPWVIHIIWVTR